MQDPKVQKIIDQIKDNLLKQFKGKTITSQTPEEIMEALKTITLNYMKDQFPLEDKIKVQAIESSTEPGVILISPSNLYTGILMTGIDRPPYWLEDTDFSWRGENGEYRMEDGKFYYLADDVCRIYYKGVIKDK